MLGLFTSKTPNVRDILVPDSAVADEAERYALVMAVVDFVNHMTNQGQYRRWEIPVEAMQIYHADYYYAQVCNGGHSQFLRNSQQNPFTLADAEAGLKAMGAGVFLDCFQKMRAWVDANPNAAREQDGFETRAADLDALDTAFYEADRNKDADFYSFARPWVRGLRALKIVPQDQYKVALDKLCAQNPLGVQRADDALVTNLTVWLTDRFRAGVQIAGRRAEPPMVVGALTAGSFIKVDGQDVIRWGLQTDRGVHFGMDLDHGVVVVREIDEEIQTDDGPRRQRREEMAAGVRTQDLDRAISHASRHNIAVGAVAALRQNGYSTGPDWIIYAEPGDEDQQHDTAVYEMRVDDDTDMLILAGETKMVLFDRQSQKAAAILDQRELGKALKDMTERQDADRAKLASLAPGRPATPVKPAAKPRRGAVSLIGPRRGKRTVLLAQYDDDALALIDEDIKDLHFQLDDPFEAGIGLYLLSRDPPLGLEEIGEPIEEWEINDEPCTRHRILTSQGTMTASAISTGVSVHSIDAGSPRATLLGITRKDRIDAAVAAAGAYPVALGLFLLLEKAGLVERFLAAGFHQTGGKGLTEVLLANPKVQDALEDPLRAAMSAPPGIRKRKQPSQHFVVAFEGATGLAIAHFGQERAALMPFQGQSDDLIQTVPVIPMEQLLYEEKAFIDRMKRRK